MSYKLSLEEIENGFIITRSSGKVYREKLDLAVKELRVAVDQLEKEARAEQAKNQPAGHP